MARFERKTCSTLLVRCHPDDYPAVKQGLKTEFRTPIAGQSRMWSVQGPLPCAVYTQRTKGAEFSSHLMILERVWQEPLFSLGPESIAAEGFDSFDEFREYWMRREGVRFRASRNVWAFRVRPCKDREEAGRMLLDRLYWEHL